MPRTAYELSVGECSAMEQKARTKAKQKSKGGSKEAVDYFKNLRLIILPIIVNPLFFQMRMGY